MERSLLEKTAKTLNEEFGLEPLINTEMPTEQLMKAIRKVSALAEETDVFEDDITNVLLELDELPENVATAFSVRVSYDDATIKQKTKENQQFIDEVDAPKESAPKQEKKKRASNKKPKPHIVLIEQLIAEGTHTAKEITESVLEKHDMKRDTIMNYIRCSKNPKYNLFSKLAQEDGDSGVFSFVD